MTVVLVSVGVVGVFGGIAALTRTEARARDTERLQRLAAQKLEELGALGNLDSAELEGDFREQGSSATWSAERTAGVRTSVDRVTVTVTDRDRSESVTGLIFNRPVTGSAGV